MSKFRLTVSDETVIEYEEIPDETQRRTFASLHGADDLINYIREQRLEPPPDGMVGIIHSGQALIEMTIIPKDSGNPIEYIFDSKKEADTFVDMQGYKTSIHMMPFEVQDTVEQFFAGEECNFENWKELRTKYQIDLETAGGTECPDCTRNSIMRKYQAKIIEIVQSNEEETLIQEK